MQINRLALIIISAVLICTSECTEKKKLKILGLFPLHGKSHFVMCETLVKGLAAAGHEIDVYSHFPLSKPVPNYNDFSLKGTLPGIINNMSYDHLLQFQTPNIDYMVGTLGSEICELMGTPKFQELFEKLKKNQPYDLVIIEMFISDCYLAWGRHLNVPMIGVMTSSLIDWYNPPLGNPINTAITPAAWSNFQYPMSFYDRLINTVMFNTIVAQFKFSISAQNKYIEKFFGPDMPHITKLPKDIDLLLVNSHYSLDGIRPYTPAIIPVGGLHVNDDGQKLPKDVQKWLDDSKDGCIYFSFGSMVRIETFPKPVLDAFYAAFKNIAPVRVLMKIAKPEILPPGLPSNVMTQSWFSQIQVLKHKNMKAFVTHGGLMSSQESIYAGVPLIGIPLFGDQPINVGKLVRKNIAIRVDLQDITETSFTEAVSKILKNPIYKETAEKFSKEFNDRPNKPINDAIFWIEYIARHGKNALRSPIVDMPWWQANLIDVYGLLTLIVVTVLYVILLILRLFRRIARWLSGTSASQSRPKKIKKKNN